MNTFRLINVNHKTVTVYMLAAAVVLMSLAASSWSAESDEKNTVWLSSLDLSRMTVGWGKPQINKSIVGKTLSIAGQKFDNGVGSHAGSKMYIDLRGGSKKFSAFVGVDDEVKGKPASIEFRIYADGKLLWSSGVMKAGQPARKVSIDLEDIKTLLLFVDSTNDGVSYDHADWAEAKFEVNGPKPKAIDPPVVKEEKIILTPKPGPEPRINGPTVYGCRPGSPFIYRIPCTGERPIAFTANKLPGGLKLDKATGIITGTTFKR